MLFKDSGIYSPKIDSSQNLVFTIKVKKDDYTQGMQQFIFDCFNEWKTLDFEIVWMDDKNDEIPKLRQRLALVMSEYAQKTKTSEEDVKTGLYTRYRVESRKELTRDQLEEAIQFYQDWVWYS